MMNVPIQEFFTREHKKNGISNKTKRGHHLAAFIFRSMQLLFLAVLLFLGSLGVEYHHQPDVYAAAIPGPGNACHWYQVRPGDTLSGIALKSKTDIWTLARSNHIANINLIFAHQYFCIPYRVSQGCNGCQGPSSGMLSSGVVRWYAYNALEQSTPQQVETLLHQAAAYYHLPPSLLLAITWQESGWEQHVISHDGGIGAMQIMPYTAMSLNAATGIRRDPYKLSDNIYLGATYLHLLWTNFHGNQTQVISAYNEGGWAVVHQGIFNWRYVNNVSYLMSVFQ